MRNNAYKIHVSRNTFILLILCNSISRFEALGPIGSKGNSKCEILLATVFSLKQKASQILPATTEQIKYFPFKKTAFKL